MRRHLLLTILLLAWPASALAKSSGGDSGFLILFGLLGAFWGYRALVDRGVKKGLETHRAEMMAKEGRERVLSTQHAEAERALTETHFKQRQEVLRAMASAFDESYINGRTWLANFIAEANCAPDEVTARALETKKHPAQKAADEVRRISLEKRALIVQLKLLQYTLQTYHEYYPVLEQYQDDILNENATLNFDEGEDSDTDRVTRYISKEEYGRLKPVERNQRALDNWRARRKSNVEIGRLYERYLGYLYERGGWTVTYLGAIQGLEDMGRDLLCTKGSAVHVVQAKYWAKHKTIHEKHIFQLYGTTILLPLSHPELKGKRVTPVFAATTALSPTASWAAGHLDVAIKAADMDPNYPLIKCNINGKNKIYHLPFDQQYDRVRIDLARGECYVRTALEAEELGFRRAMRHMASAA